MFINLFAIFKLAQIFFSRIQKLVEEQKTRLEIDRKLNYDALTNLPNYSKFMEMASNYVATNENSNLYFVYSDFSKCAVNVVSAIIG